MSTYYQVQSLGAYGPFAVVLVETKETKLATKATRWEAEELIESLKKDDQDD